MGDLSIGEIARCVGITASAVRFYERHGLLVRPPRRSGRRCYDPSDVAQLRLIVGARKAGLRLTELKRLLDVADDRGARSQLLEATSNEIAHRIRALSQLREAIDAAAACTCMRPAECPVAERLARPAVIDQAFSGGA